MPRIRRALHLKVSASLNVANTLHLEIKSPTQQPQGTQLTCLITAPILMSRPIAAFAETRTCAHPHSQTLYCPNRNEDPYHLRRRRHPYHQNFLRHGSHVMEMIMKILRQ